LNHIPLPSQQPPRLTILKRCCKCRTSRMEVIPFTAIAGPRLYWCSNCGCRTMHEVRVRK